MITGHRPRRRSAAPPRRRAASRTGRHPWSRFAVLAAAVPVGLLVSGALVWHSSYAAFVATTLNENNSWTTGVVSLTSNRTASVPLFDQTSEGFLSPGSTGTKCITVSYTGSVTVGEEGIRLRGTVTGDPGLASALQIQVQLSQAPLPGPPGADCLPSFPATPLTYSTTLSAFPTTYADGLGDLDNNNTGDWRPVLPTTDTSRTYRITYTLPTSASGTQYQGKQVGLLLTWQVQSDDTPGS